MKTKIIARILLLIILAAFSTALSQPAYRAGYCDGKILHQYNGVGLNNVYARDQFYVVDGWFTIIDIGKPQGPFSGKKVKGRHTSTINQALYLISQEGYTTVDITLYQSGWYMRGAYNPELARQAAREIELQAQREWERRQREKSRKTQAAESKRTKSCEEHLYSDIRRTDYKISAEINVTGEYIYVTWSTTENWEGTEWWADVYITNRSGVKRKLKSGKNWVDPARYELQLEYGNIISTGVTVKYECQQ